MSSGPGQFLQARILNGWSLFWLVSGSVSLLMVSAMLRSELTSGPAISELIQLSVRLSVPWLFLAFAASSLQVVRPGVFSQWLARNRKYIGLCFAAAMAWQGFFILWLVLVFTDYYVSEVYVMRDAIEGVVGYAFLVAMTLTSFAPFRRRLSARNWKRLHKIGIYYLWAYAFSVYWWELYYYPDPDGIDYVFYWAGFAAWGLRAAAWARQRHAKEGQGGNMLAGVAGWLAIAVGLVAAGTGKLWYPTAERLLTGYSVTRVPELYLPYWPFEPWLPLFVVGLGAMLVAAHGNSPGASRPSR